MPATGLSCLRSVGPATLHDFALLGITTLEELAAANPHDLYERLCDAAGQPIDICQYDAFCCAVAQARDPLLPAEQKNWFWWSKQRKARCR